MNANEALRLNNRIQWWVLALLLFLPLIGGMREANAQLVINEPAFGPTLYCITKADAQEMAQAVAEVNEEKFQEKQTPGVCHFHPAQFIPKKLLATFENTNTVYVIEVESSGKTFYLVTMVKFVGFRGNSA